MATNIRTKGTQILVGSGCSGKTYVTIDLARKIVDKDVFVFQSRERINNEAFSSLLHRENCLIIADSKVLVKSQVKHTTIRQKVYKKYSPQNVQVNE